MSQVTNMRHELLVPDFGLGQVVLVQGRIMKLEAFLRYSCTPIFQAMIGLLGVMALLRAYLF